ARCSALRASDSTARRMCAGVPAETTYWSCETAGCASPRPKAVAAQSRIIDFMSLLPGRERGHQVRLRLRNLCRVHGKITLEVEPLLFDVLGEGDDERIRVRALARQREVR